MNFITYAQQELNRQGYRVTLAQSHENPNAELANLQMFEDYRVEGILISVCHTEKNLATYQRIMKKRHSYGLFLTAPCLLCQFPK